MGGTPPQSLHSTMKIQLGMVINVASEMALNQEILPLAMLRKHLWDKAAEIQTWEEWSNSTPVIFLLLTKYIYVDSLWTYIYTDVGRQTPTDAVYALGWPDTSQLWSGSQTAFLGQLHRIQEEIRCTEQDCLVPGSESAWGQTYTCFSTHTSAVVAQ